MATAFTEPAKATVWAAGLLSAKPKHQPKDHKPSMPEWGALLPAATISASPAPRSLALPPQ